MSRKALADRTGPVKIQGRLFLGARDAQKVAARFAEIAEHEKSAVKLFVKTAQAYFDAGGILAAALRGWNYKAARITVKAVSDASGFQERRIACALKIFRSFEHSPDAIGGLSLRDALRLIAPPQPSGEEGYNRIDLGGDPGQLRLDFGELFELPAAACRALQSYRTVADMLTEIIAVHKAKNGQLTSRRFMHFCEDIPQSKALRYAYETMSLETQAAIEKYLAAVEQEEDLK